jgi:hypothetical protein
MKAVQKLRNYVYINKLLFFQGEKDVMCIIDDDHPSFKKDIVDLCTCIDRPRIIRGSSSLCDLHTSRMDGGKRAASTSVTAAHVVVHGTKEASIDHHLSIRKLWASLSVRSG